MGAAEGKQAVWNSGRKSRYIAETGKSPTVWPGFTVSYWAKTRRLEAGDFKGAPCKGRGRA